MFHPIPPAHVGFAILALACALDASAQSTPIVVKRVAYLSSLPEGEGAARIAAIGKRIDSRWPAQSRPDGTVIEYRTFRFELPATTKATPVESEEERSRRNAGIAARNDGRISEMLAWGPDLIFAPGALAAKAAARASAVIPVVFGCKCNPLPDGFDLVKVPSRPERNLTGFTRYHIDMVAGDAERRLNLHRKRIELLQLASEKHVRRIAAIYGDEYDENKWRYDEAARGLGAEWVKVRLTEGSIEELPARLREARADAGLVLADTFLDKFTLRLVKASIASPVPVMFPWDEADLGAWMHYGTVVDFSDKAAEYIVNILQGRRVADYPVEFPKQMELAVNFRTANVHHWTFPKRFLLQVDRPIE